MHAAAVLRRSLDQPAAIADVVVLGKERRLTVVAALNHMQGLLGEESGLRAAWYATIARTLIKIYSDPDYAVQDVPSPESSTRVFPGPRARIAA